MLHALIEAGVQRGLSASAARSLVLAVGHRLGDAGARPSGQPLHELVQDVCVPGGSTERAVAVMEQAALGQTVDVAVQASWRRNREMAHERD